MTPNHSTVLMAMEKIVNNRINWSKIGKRLALRRPDIFLELIGDTMMSPEERIRMAVEKYEVGKICAIKLARNILTDDLRKAKEYIEDTYEDHDFRNPCTNWDELPSFIRG